MHFLERTCRGHRSCRIWPDRCVGQAPWPVMNDHRHGVDGTGLVWPGARSRPDIRIEAKRVGTGHVAGAAHEVEARQPPEHSPTARTSWHSGFVASPDMQSVIGDSRPAGVF